MLGQGFMPTPPLELPAELVVLCDKKIYVLLCKDVPGVNILGISLPGSLRDESGGVIRLLEPGRCRFPLP